MESLKHMKDTGISDRALYRIHGLQIEVKIKDMRKIYSRVDYLVEPISGKGMSWVSSDSVIPIK
jgi:hypothetical protein